MTISYRSSALAGLLSLLVASPVLAQATSVSRAGAISEGGPTSTSLAPLPNASLTEGFEGAFPPAGWIVRNQSTVVGSNVNCWNQFGATPWPANSGANHAGANFNCTTGTNTISGWLISSQLTSIQNGDEISFFTRRIDSGFVDRLEVRVCIDGAPGSCGAAGSTGALATDVGQFTTLALSVNPDLLPGVYPTVYTQFTTTITGLAAGGDGRIAFRYFVTDGGPTGDNSDLLSIDDVSVVPGVLPGELTVAPAAIDFGTVNVGVTSASQAITLSNTGGGPLTVNAITAAAAPFSVTGGTCVATPFDLAVGASCTVEYAFTPAAVGASSQNFFVTSGGVLPGAPSFALSGTGGLPPGMLTVAPAAIDFGNVNIGVTSASQAITLGNSGGSPLTINAITAAAAPFAVTGGSCAATPFDLAVGASCTVEYAFTPAAAGAASQDFFVTSGGVMPGAPSFVLSGTGVLQPGVLGVSTTTLAFGGQTVGSTSLRTLTVSNTGAGPLNVTAISLPAAPFSLAAGGTCGAVPFSLAAGTSCTLIYSFAPLAAGAANSSVTINTDGGDSTVALSGTGVVPIALNMLSSLSLAVMLGIFGITGIVLMRRNS